LKSERKRSVIYAKLRVGQIETVEYSLKIRVKDEKEIMGRDKNAGGKSISGSGIGGFLFCCAKPENYQSQEGISGYAEHESVVCRRSAEAKS
jgi:hypothetical protein